MRPLDSKSNGLMGGIFIISFFNHFFYVTLNYLSDELSLSNIIVLLISSLRIFTKNIMHFAKNKPTKASYLIPIGNFVISFSTGDAVCNCVKMPVVKKDKNFVMN